MEIGSFFSDWLENLNFNSGDLLSAVISIAFILVITKVALLVFKKLLLSRHNASDIDHGRRRSIYLLLRYILWVIALAFVIEACGVKVTVLIAGSAALLVGFGLGMQQLFLDVVSGVLLLFDGSVEIDDIIEVDGMVGRVDSMNLRTSRIATRDNIFIIVPNHKLIEESVINWTHNNLTARFNVKVGVAYGSDVDLICKILVDSCKELPQILSEPAPNAFCSDFGDSSLDFEVYFWSEEIFRIEPLKGELRSKISKNFKENNIEIPFPQRVIHMSKD